MGRGMSDTDRFNTIATIISQVDINKIGIDWQKAATDLGLTSAGSARWRWQTIMKRGTVAGTASAPASAARKASTGNAKRSRPAKNTVNRKNTVKRKAAEIADEESAQDENDAEDEYDAEEESGSGEATRLMKGRKGKGAKRAKMDNGGEDADCEVGFGTQEFPPIDDYLRDPELRDLIDAEFKYCTQGEDWFNQQPSPKGDDYDVQQYDQSEELGFQDL